jgi:hypothetical protein
MKTHRLVYLSVILPFFGRKKQKLRCCGTAACHAVATRAFFQIFFALIIYANERNLLNKEQKFV